MGLRLKERYSEFLRQFEWMARYYNDLKESAPVQRFIRHRNHIALSLYILWIAGCGYWIYKFLIIKVTPSTYSFVSITDPQDARIFLFFGMFGGFFLLFVILFILKFIYNLFHDGFYRLLPSHWYSLGRSMGYLLILFFAFTYIKYVKIAGLTIYNRVTELASLSQQQDEISLKNLSDLQELLRDLDDHKEEDEN